MGIHEDRAYVFVHLWLDIGLSPCPRITSFTVLRNNYDKYGLNTYFKGPFWEVFLLPFFFGN